MPLCQGSVSVRVNGGWNAVVRQVPADSDADGAIDPTGPEGDDPGLAPTDGAGLADALGEPEGATEADAPAEALAEAPADALAPGVWPEPRPARMANSTIATITTAAAATAAIRPPDDCIRSRP
jgi:hypothetical protein